MFGPDPTFSERMLLVQTGHRAAQCNVDALAIKLVAIGSAGALSLFFMLVTTTCLSILPMIALLIRTATKLAIAWMLMQPYLAPSEPEPLAAPPAGLMASAAAEALVVMLSAVKTLQLVCAAAGAALALYAICRFLLELRDIKIPNAVFRMVGPTMREHRSAVLQVWLVFAVLNFAVVSIWNAVQVPLSTLATCADLCTSKPSSLRMGAEAFWFVSSLWTSSFVTKLMYERVAIKMVRGDDAGFEGATDLGNVAVAAILVTAAEWLWHLMTLPFGTIRPMWGAATTGCVPLCCCCDICPWRRVLMYYEANVLGRYRNFVLWRAVKDGTGFHDAVIRQNAALVHPHRHAALECRQHELVDSALDAIPFAVGAVCACQSLRSCELLTQALECYISGNLIASAIVSMHYSYKQPAFACGGWAYFDRVLVFPDHSNRGNHGPRVRDDGRQHRPVQRHERVCSVGRN